jgi:hypothetical protein
MTVQTHSAPCPQLLMHCHCGTIDITADTRSDRKVKIWSTLPILDQAAEADEANHKLLCTMSEHTGEPGARA